jgi:cytochrome c oxidase subunit II
VRFNPKPVVLAGALIALLAAAAPAGAGNGGFAPVPPESPNAEGITESFWLVSLICLGIFLLVEGLLIAFVIRYRRRNRPRDADGAQIHGSSALELAWTAFPVLLLVIIATFVFVKLPGIQDVPAASAGQENLEIEVTGSQFTWEYRYPNGVIAVDRLRVPEGRTVELHVTAPEWDVIHSWWIPALGGKIDAIPGRLNHTWFRAQRAGVFEGNCAEYCGLNHSRMVMNVHALPAGEFDAELERLSSSGRAQFEAACAKCHNVSGPQLVGPTLQGNPTLADAVALATLVRNGRNEMPPVGAGWSDEQIQNLVNYTKTIAGSGQ